MGFQEENYCRSEQIAAHLGVQAWATTTGMADVPIPSVQAVCEPCGAWHPSGPGLRDAKLNLKCKVDFNPSATPLRKERICICLGLLGNVCLCPSYLGTFWVSPGAGAVLGGHAFRVCE